MEIQQILSSLMNEASNIAENPNMVLALLTAFGGLALILFGFSFFSTALQVLLGAYIEKVLKNISESKVKIFGLGVFLSSVFQSSSYTTTALMGLIKAEMINVPQAFIASLGIGISLALSTYFMSLNVGVLSLPIMAVGFLFSIVFTKEKWAKSGEALFGLSLVFLGMSLISGQLGEIFSDGSVLSVLSQLSVDPLMGVLAGALIAALFRNSLVISPLLLVFSFYSEKIIGIPAVISLIGGSFLGVAFTALVSQPKHCEAAKRFSRMYAFSSIVCVAILLPLSGYFSDVLAKFSGGLSLQIVMAYLIFSVFMILIFALLLPLLKALFFRITPADKDELSDMPYVKYIDKNTKDIPVVALYLGQMEAVRMAKITLEMLNFSKKIFFEFSGDMVHDIKNREIVVDALDEKIRSFLSKIDKRILSEFQLEKIVVLDHAATDIERIADHINNICELVELKEEKRIPFTQIAIDELEGIFAKAYESLEQCIAVILEDHIEDAIKNILKIEQETDEMVVLYEAKHMDRLEEGSCRPEAGPIFLDFLRNLERITDLAHNIACTKKFGF